MAVRADGDTSPPAKTPGSLVIMAGFNARTPSSTVRASSSPRSERSVSCPMASTSESASSSSNSPVGRGIPSSPVSIRSTVMRVPEKLSTVESHRTVTPSASAASSSSVWAGIRARVRR